jgi:iron(II)-dependent oxidoreductase
MVGTPIYMSPEQVTGGAVDHRADLYALGVMGYEMLVGRPPFGGVTPTEILMKRVAERAQPVERARTDTPPELAAVVNRCLEQDPEKRFASGAEIVRALGGATPTSPQPTLETLRRHRRDRLPLALALGAVLVLVSVLAALLLRQGEAHRQAAAVAAPEGMVLVPAGTYTIGRNDGPAWGRPAHRVTLGAFYMDRIEVTVGAFRHLAYETTVGVGWTAPAAGDSLLPVTGVKWPMAMAFCGLAHPPRGRLPTEEEWEAAARGPNGSRYPWGDAWQSALANTASARQKGPLAVGSLRRGNSPLGIADLVGNVWEWTASGAVAYLGGTTPPRSSRDEYVIRGGAYNTPDSIADATYRGYLPAMSADLSLTGFRCVVPVQ